MNNYCYKPFSEIEIYSSGEVYTCCPSYLPENYYIGNIFEVKTFDEIWYSDKAINLRKNILEKDFSICNLKICSLL